MTVFGTQAYFGKEREADGRLSSFLDINVLEPTSNHAPYLGTDL